MAIKRAGIEYAGLEWKKFKATAMGRFLLYHKMLVEEGHLLLRNWLRYAGVLFLVAIIAGFVLYGLFPHFLEPLADIFKEKFGSDPSLNFGLAWKIFLNNAGVVLFALAGGVFVGLAPITLLAANGIIIGYIFAALLFAGPGSFYERVFLLLAGILPHGIVEIPALLFSAALGLRLGINWLGKPKTGSRFSVFKKDLLLALAFLPVILLALFIAALLEVYITPIVIGFVAG